MSDILQPGKKQAEKAAALQEQQIAEQKKVEQLKLAEAESDVARRKATGARGGGRGSLIATGQTGVTGNLGGS